MLGGTLIGCLSRCGIKKPVYSNKIYVSIVDMSLPAVDVTYLQRLSGTKISIDWGDGTSSEYAGSAPTSTNVSWNSHIYHVYSEPGDYVVSISDNCKMFGTYAAQAYSSTYPYTYNNRTNVVGVEYGPDCNPTVTGAQLCSTCYNLRFARFSNWGIVPQNSFYNCFNLSEVGDMSNVTAIYSQAFYSCKSLESNTLAKGLPECTNLSTSAFSGCRSLKSVGNFPKCTTIGATAFDACDNIEKIGDFPLCTSVGGTFARECFNLVEVGNFPSLTSIGTYAFQNCVHLRKIGDISNVTTLGGYAFTGCSDLERIPYTPNITAIDTSTFSSCSDAVLDRSFPNVSTIGSSAFNGCRNITKITNEEFPACTGITSPFGTMNNVEIISLRNSTSSMPFSNYMHHVREMEFPCSAITTSNNNQTLYQDNNLRYLVLGSIVSVGGSSSGWSSNTIGTYEPRMDGTTLQIFLNQTIDDLLDPSRNLNTWKFPWCNSTGVGGNNVRIKWHCTDGSVKMDSSGNVSRDSTEKSTDFYDYSRRKWILHPRWFIGDDEFIEKYGLEQ